MARTVIDAHQHFWDPAAADYPWMTGAFEPLRRAFGPSDLAPLLDTAGVTGTIAVQARQEVAETHDLLEMAAATDWIVGVVGWVDLTQDDVRETIDEIRDGDHGGRLVGMRHLVHDEPDPEWLLRHDVMRGLAAVADAGLVYDLLVRTRELPAATEVARRLPELRLVVDHLAKPPIASQSGEHWVSAIGEIARLPNVTCKVSGLVTEADWASWAAADVAPYVSTVVKMFGPDRLMWGSDWPVCTLAASYLQVLEVAREVLADEVGHDLASVLGQCAIATYGLDAERHPT
jgi:L-fuconolactonase